MKEVDMYIRGVTSMWINPVEGYYLNILCYKGHKKELYKMERGGHITPNRMIIKALINGLQVLKESCKVNIYTHAYIGLGKLRSQDGSIMGVKNSVNKDLLLILQKEIIEGKHKVTEEVSGKGQDELARRIRYRRKMMEKDKGI